MGKYVNRELIKEKEKEKIKTAEQSKTILELAEKETRIKKLEDENAKILMELATLKGGI